MAKIGSEHFMAMMRTGLNEVRALLYPESNVAQPTELGVFGTKTSGEVTVARREAVLEQEVEQPQPSILNRKLEQSKSTEDRSPERTKERDAVVME